MLVRRCFLRQGRQERRSLRCLPKRRSRPRRWPTTDMRLPTSRLPASRAPAWLCLLFFLSRSWERCDSLEGPLRPRPTADGNLPCLVEVISECRGRRGVRDTRPSACPRRRAPKCLTREIKTSDTRRAVPANDMATASVLQWCGRAVPNVPNATWDYSLQPSIPVSSVVLIYALYRHRRRHMPRTRHRRPSWPFFIRRRLRGFLWRYPPMSTRQCLPQSQYTSHRPHSDSPAPHFSFWGRVRLVSGVAGPTMGRIEPMATDGPRRSVR